MLHWWDFGTKCNQVFAWHITLLSEESGNIFFQSFTLDGFVMEELMPDGLVMGGNSCCMV